MTSAAREDFKNSIRNLRDQHKVGGEFKWQKLSPSREEFYSDLASWFFSMGDKLRFRCIAVDQGRVNLDGFHEGDHELGFYKFYYQMIHHWILDFNTYSIFCDYKCNRKNDRLHVLKRCLNHANLSSSVKTVQAIRSRESTLMQLSDFLTGMASARINESLVEGSVKERVTVSLEEKLGRQIRHTVRDEQKFNVFKIDLSGGW